MKHPNHIEYPKMDGIYKHYKGGIYQVISLSKHSENDETLVIYKSLLFGSIHTRPLTSWSETVDDVPRFTLNEGLASLEKEEILNSYKWVKVKKYVMDKTLSWEERYKELEKHHIEETTFLINKIRDIVKN